jgi:DNA-binding NarL/FixJ family response regulator
MEDAMAVTLTGIRVLVWAPDPISNVGLSTALRSQPDIVLVGDAEACGDTVVLAVVDRLDDSVVRHLRGRQARGQSRFVLVTTELTDSNLLTAVELGVRAVALRADITPEALVRLARTAASGDATLPPDLLGRLLNQVSRLQRQVLTPMGWNTAGLTAREIEVLRLVAQGLSTGEIAERLSYSQRTIKTVLHNIINRFQLRNRTHAVAYAMQQGLI